MTPATLRINSPPWPVMPWGSGCCPPLPSALSPQYSHLCTRLTPASGPLHCLFLLLKMLFPSLWGVSWLLSPQVSASQDLLEVQPTLHALSTPQGSQPQPRMCTHSMLMNVSWTSEQLKHGLTTNTELAEPRQVLEAPEGALLSLTVNGFGLAVG